MKTYSCLLVSGILVFIQSCQNPDELKNQEAVKKVILDEGLARQTNNVELFSSCWSHETYILNYWAINWGCTTINGWDELLDTFKKGIEYNPTPEYKIRRENFNTHVNGNIAVSDFDLFIDNFNGENLVAKANVTLEKANGLWKIIYLNVFFEESFNKPEQQH
jgi:hypothetical protein